ncbi:hypothetical protein M9H77_22178 [Catharanthus roseus]|uniref:Uncharacterized protein n=1 Tax=Catharanthus roseus TaxID=4058 RepID=A0ACC0ARG4_CATRO|nr:hypothetical protein M9H77_22178 [Catharanthus roseus]
MESLNLSLKNYEVSSEGDVACDDRISNLLDSIFYFILSFPPIIESVQTSVLSTSLSDNYGKFYTDTWVSVANAKIFGPIAGQPLHLQNPGVYDIIQFTTYNPFTVLDVTFDDSNHYSYLTVEINALSLEYLDLGYCIIREFILNNLLTLIEAYIELCEGIGGDPNSVKLAQEDVYQMELLKVKIGKCKKETKSKSVKGSYFDNTTLASFYKLPRLSKLAVNAECCQWNKLLYILESLVNLYVEADLEVSSKFEMLRKICVFCRISQDKLLCNLYNTLSEYYPLIPLSFGIFQPHSISFTLGFLPLLIYPIII